MTDSDDSARPPLRTRVAIALLASCVLWVAVLAHLGVSAAQAKPAGEYRLEIVDRTAEGGGLTVIGGRGARTRRVEVSSDLAAGLAGVRFSVECASDPDCNDQRLEPIEGQRPLLDEEMVTQVIAEGGQAILQPFAEEIRKATQLRIHIPRHLLRIAIDVLDFDGAPLYVRLPIVYTVDRDASPSKTTIQASSLGLLISDPTADPQRAVYDVADLFPKSLLFDAVDFDEAKLEHVPSVDFAVVSAHGRAGYADRDEIGLPPNRVLALDTLARLRPQLVYLDSCNMGISGRYIDALRNAGVKHLLAPVISNEAGESSTVTMRVFFGEILAGRDPVTALHTARAHAYEIYGRRGVMAQLLRAFPFRIYALN